MEGQRNEYRIAVQLGRALAESNELLRLRKAQAELELDKEAEKLFEMIRLGKAEAREGTARNNPVVAELLDAEKEFNNLLKTINGIIGFYVTGKESVTVKGRDCGGCAGCDEVRGHTSS